VNCSSRPVRFPAAAKGLDVERTCRSSNTPGISPYCELTTDPEQSASIRDICGSALPMLANSQESTRSGINLRHLPNLRLLLSPSRRVRQRAVERYPRAEMLSRAVRCGYGGQRWSDGGVWG